jgi:hypothetical protein
MRLRLAVPALLAACGGDPSSSGPDAAAVDAGGADAATCVRAPAAADRVRKIVVSHPFAPGENVYQVLDLAADGAISDPGVTFTMGKGNLGAIAFTPDGEVGLVAQDDGSIGVFRFDDDGAPVVVDAAFTSGDLYATGIVMDPGGAFAYVLDDQWRENGGGIYRLAIGCDGAVTDLGRWLPSKLPAGIALRGDRLIVAATDVDGSATGDDVHALDRDVEPPLPTAGADAFGDDDAIVAGTALTSDHAYFLVGDNSAFSGVPNRVAVVGISDDGDSVTPLQVLSPIEDPLALIASPFGDVVLAVSGFGDAVFVLDQDGPETAPFSVRGEMTYVGASPQLPGGAVMIEQGALRGMVIVAENLGVRRIQLEGGGVVTDLGLTALGSDNAAITGVIGVQP